MSSVLYIASDRELPITPLKKAAKVITFKSEKPPEGCIPLDQIIDLSDVMENLSEDEVEQFDTYEDAAGIVIRDLSVDEKEIGKQFKNKFIYELSASWGDFYLNEMLKNKFPSNFKANRKCICKLFEFIKENAGIGRGMELYKCWIGEEGQDRNKQLDMEIDLKSFVLGDSFELEDRQYIVFKV
ncbi:MAG: hypothetical protein Q8920_10075 [Bacillota bacterium]|nr:hypothetical protein [Bacillota bacterium]